MDKSFIVLFLVTVSFDLSLSGILQARSSETRDIISLDGLWYFTTNETFIDNIKEANDLDINLMPVPSSFNDITTRKMLRDHVGSVWYQRFFFVPTYWKNKRVWIRFGSVCHKAIVIINGQRVASHQIGHLPFAVDISSSVVFGEENTVTVEVDNTLSETTIPQGSVEVLPSGRKKQFYTFDFFNYAGIDRSVLLYSTNRIAHVDDITITTFVNGTTGLVNYTVTIVGDNSSISHQVNILNKEGIVVASSSSQNSSELLIIENATLWWPFLMDPNPGYLYTFEVIIMLKNVTIDHYKQPFGIRELQYDNDSFKINGRNIYIRGFGRHEDSDIRGKGLDLPLIIRDYNLIKWIGANCYRTSHYPYDEEIMDLADQLGIMIIDESPAVNTEKYSDDLLENHRQSLTELYQRDKNRPSVIMWSIANEPRADWTDALSYFLYYQHVSEHIKSLDISRPITIANTYKYHLQFISQFLDILSFNRYQAWYENEGETDIIYSNIVSEARGWRTWYNKPVLITEYGADCLEGLSILPSFMWSEEFQLDVMQRYFTAFDELRKEEWFIGEMIWNFADFKTDQSYIRVGGNKKGIFTRNRQPKASAFLLRKRYWALANKLDNAILPEDLDKYVIDMPLE